jgi:hypothetical protein
LRSMSSSSCDRTSERGYVLVAAIAIAVLYFALMELMLIDSSRSLREAQRFRSKVVATTLAESAAELSAASMVTRKAGDTIKADDEQGSMTATCDVNGSASNIGNVNEWRFEIKAEATTSGVSPVTSSVGVQGRIIDQRVKIDYTFHSQ